jgi:hypothetical protein
MQGSKATQADLEDVSLAHSLDDFVFLIATQQVVVALEESWRNKTEAAAVGVTQGTVQKDLLGMRTTPVKLPRHALLIVMSPKKEQAVTTAALELHTYIMARAKDETIKDATGQSVNVKRKTSQIASTFVRRKESLYM